MRALAFIAFLNRAIRPRVVFIAIDIAADCVLLAIHLSALLVSQVPAVSGAVRANFLMDGRFFIFEVAGFARRQLP
jgi:hypothetical protein